MSLKRLFKLPSTSIVSYRHPVPGRGQLRITCPSLEMDNNNVTVTPGTRLLPHCLTVWWAPRGPVTPWVLPWSVRTQVAYAKLERGRWNPTRAWRRDRSPYPHRQWW
ncbi:hypothetical protein GW17_00023720 [Ensete ventricosum]|nr:hypothetical protein GW17_00023720 [Ensete ventricosum]RZS09297.1 hypothetical protein BHM03_00040364 [Ensete ventricosum]